MIVLKANQQQYESLNGFTNGNNKLKFTKDGNGNWIVGLSVLSSKAFVEIKDDLDSLERIDYAAPIQDELEIEEPE